jgi:hypothetical protein
MAASSGLAHADSEEGKLWRWIKRPFEVPARMRTAGRLRRTLFGALPHGLTCSWTDETGICATAGILNVDVLPLG